MAYSYKPPTVPCTKCDTSVPIPDLKHVPQTLFISYAGGIETDINGDTRKELAIVQVQATQCLCADCDIAVKRDRIKRMQEYDDIGIIEVGSAAFDTFIDTYSDIAGDKDWDVNKYDIYGEPTIYSEDTSGAFTAGAIRDYSVAQYFAAAPEAKADEPIEIKDDDDDVIVMDKKGHFEVDELSA